MRKFLIFILCITIIIALFLNFNKKACLLKLNSEKKAISLQKEEKPVSIDEAFQLLKFRKDADALVIFEKVLAKQPNNLEALWGKAEVLRRSRDYSQSEVIFQEILNKNPGHIPSLISMAYIKCKDNNLDEATKLVNRVLNAECLDKDNQALAYVMLGNINSRRAIKGGIFSKIKYGTKIKSYFLKAKELSPDLPEIHLALGTFYLLAPKIIGGNLEKAMEELEYTIKIAPDFATANARLAQYHKIKGDSKKYAFYFNRAKELDPENDVLQELK
jgi:tetratricopeptide (TPR) repeat protein